MATIKLPERKPKPKMSEEQKHTDNKLLRQKAYNSTKWQKLRTYYMARHPLCEECLKRGKVEAATQIHHIRSPFDYQEGTVNWNLFLDDNNLEAVCAVCHQNLHNKKNQATPEEMLAALEELFNDIEDDD